MVGTFLRDCRCAVLWCDHDLTFDLAFVTLTYKILSGLVHLGFITVRQHIISVILNCLVIISLSLQTCFLSCGLFSPAS